jgi:hypothetical protein
MKEEQFIERRIITGLIISTDYLTEIRKIWNSKLIGSSTAKRIANWCIEFYDQYHTAPGQEIESIFLRKTKNEDRNNIKDIEDILSSLSDEYEHQDKFNVPYLIDQTKQYFDERDLREFSEGIQADLDEGNILQAKRDAYAYTPSIEVTDNDIELSDKNISEFVEKAFKTASQPVVKYSRQLGSFLNDQLVRGGFVAFMGPEKRGKTFFLLDIGMRASRQGANVAFFQAGDMTQDQQLKRMCIYLAKKSDKKKYSGVMYEPVRDCIFNQLDTCDRKQRECDFGIFEDRSERYLRKEIKRKEIIEAYEDNEDYKPCYNCSKYWSNQWGAVWLKKINTGNPLDVNLAKKKVNEFFVKNNRRFKLSSHPTKTLKVSDIDLILDTWERKDGFVADLIIVDYADILAPENNMDFRQQENDKWMYLRKLSQKRHALVVTVTQTDADSYTKDTIGLKNFSEDKRKYAHVTAMYGLNQDRTGREKELGIMRINEQVIREGDSLNSNQVYILQNLSRGQSCLSSFF